MKHPSLSEDVVKTYIPRQQMLKSSLVISNKLEPLLIKRNYKTEIKINSKQSSSKIQKEIQGTSRKTIQKQPQLYQQYTFQF